MSNSTLYPVRLRLVQPAIITVFACVVAMLFSVATFMPTANAAEASTPQADETLVPQNLAAQETTLPVAPTKCGTCLWSIDSTGKLTIAPEEGDTGTLEDWQANPPWKDYCYQITAVDIEGTVIAPTCGHMFTFCQNLVDVDLEGLDTSQAHYMNYMFQGCLKLASLDVSMLDTSETTSMLYMFGTCQKLTSLDLTSFNTSKVQDMTGMFAGCELLTSVNMEGLDTSSVTNMSFLLQNCPTTSVDFSKIDTSSVQNMQGMFLKNTASTLNLTGLNTSSVSNMSSMFEDCNKLTSLDLSGFDTHSTINMNKMFSGCTKLQTITVGKNWAKLGAAANTTGMFTSCNALVGANGTSFAAMQVADGTYARVDFADLPGYLTPSTDWEEPTVTPVAQDIDSTCVWTIDIDGTLTLSPLEGNQGALSTFAYAPWRAYRAAIRSFKVEGTIKATSLCNMFYGCTSLTDVDLTGLDTRYASDFTAVFEKCTSLESVDLSMLDTRAIYSATWMFHNCKSLTSVNFANWNTKNLRHMGHMFEGCTSLARLDLSSFNTPSLEVTQHAFYGCTSLETILVSDRWTPVSGEYTTGMFKDCNVLVGANGTAYADKQVDDGTYSCIDTAEKPGYLSPADYTGSDEGNGNGGNDTPSGDDPNSGGTGGNGGGTNTPSGDDPNNGGTNTPGGDKPNGNGGNTSGNNNGNGDSNTNSQNNSKRISIAKAVVKLSKSTYVYDGKAHTPKVTVKLGGKTLKANRDYTVSYAKGRKAIGTYKVTIAGKGSYKGKAYASFKIVLGSPSMTSIAAKINSDGTFGFVASWKKASTSIAGYQIRWSLSKSFKNAKSYTFDSSSSFAKQNTIALQVKSRSWLGKKAYVQMRTFKTVGKKRYYSSWSTVKTVKLKK